jgi:hypothetical protein
MKSVTIMVEDEVAEWASREAARRNSSLSELMGELLAEKMRCGESYESAMREALKFKSWGRSEGDYLARAEVRMRGGE